LLGLDQRVFKLDVMRLQLSEIELIPERKSKKKGLLLIETQNRPRCIIFIMLSSSSMKRSTESRSYHIDSDIAKKIGCHKVICSGLKRDFHD
jgi:hypothetical protein